MFKRNLLTATKHKPEEYQPEEVKDIKFRY